MGVQATTLPIDTAKVRLQLQKKAVAGDAAAVKYKGLLDTVATITKEEGLAALWKGIVPGLHRQCLFGGLRIGLYDPVCLFISFLAIFCTFSCNLSMYLPQLILLFIILSRLNPFMAVEILLVIFHCQQKYSLHLLLVRVRHCDHLTPFSLCVSWSFLSIYHAQNYTKHCSGLILFLYFFNDRSNSDYSSKSN